ncbi:MAG: 6-pyruvoyl-tetrahydropterin synthase-related protein [Acidobacteriaceae bacterium]
MDGGPIISRPRPGKQSKTTANVWSRPNRWTGLAIILVAALLAMGPLLWRGSSSLGNDLGFHFLSWIDARQGMSMGFLYPHWAYSPNFGAGEPRFVFYPPISWMAGAILGMLLPWSVVPLVLSILLLAATGLAVRALARETMADGPATLAGCAAIFLGYALFNVYKRCAFAEMTGGFWVPLLLLYALRRRNPSGNFWERAFDGSAAPLALIVAGIWLSNGPVGIMAGYLLAAVALVSAGMEKSLVPVLRAAVGTILGMGLASFYLIPAIWERKWASIQLAFTLSHSVVENNWLFARHADPGMLSHDVFLIQVSLVAVAMLVVAFAGGAIAWFRGVVPGERRWWLPLALIPPVVLFLLLPVSLPVWYGLPELRTLPFPWRWLVVLEAPMAICFASAAWFDRRALRIPMLAACAALFMGISLAAFPVWFVEGTSLEASIQKSVREDVGVLGQPEYAPPGIRFPLVDRIVHSACLLDSPPDATLQSEAGLAPAWDGESASCNSSSWQEAILIGDPSQSDAAPYMQEQKRIMGVAEHAGYLILRLRYYPAWGVRVNGIPVTPRAERERGLMAVPVPQGKVQVSVDWTTTSDVVAGRWVSAVALLLVTGLYLFERKRLQAHLNMGRASSLVANAEPKPRNVIPSVRTGSRNTPSSKKPKTIKRK